MRPCDYPRDTILAAIALVKQVVGEQVQDDTPFNGTPEDVARMNHARGRRSVVTDLEGTLKSRDREDKDKKP